ncbi:hypothetical protein [Streptomyces phaeolivaceus]|uniref:hypothetical protein n=1 Tax=Streptomyces phaeolivaceus TaxID=2653200 RepID=UPI001869E058|nr:hypothetical protein [Streptomyces phaeolivaceus]
MTTSLDEHHTQFFLTRNQQTPFRASDWFPPPSGTSLRLRPIDREVPHASDESEPE